MEPLDISSIRDEQEKNMRENDAFIDEIAKQELLDIID